MLIPSISVNEVSNTKRYENLTLDIDRMNLVKEENTQYKSKLEDLVNFKNEEISLDDKRWEMLSEEIHAYITGYVYSGDADNVVRPFLRDYDAVKNAVDAFFDEYKKFLLKAKGMFEKIFEFAFLISSYIVTQAHSFKVLSLIS